jgi:hypothetical protein
MAGGVASAACDALGLGLNGRNLSASFETHSLEDLKRQDDDQRCHFRRRGHPP